MKKPQVIVTRPAEDADAWVDALAARGFDVTALPLIAIGPAPDASALRTAWQALPRYRAAMFVSANAVRGFFAARGDAPWPPGVRAWAPGPGTAAALEEAGPSTLGIDRPPAGAGRFDSEALWAVVAPQIGPGDRVLVVRGSGAGASSPLGSGRDWLAARIAEAGGTTDFALAYRRGAPVFDARQRQRAVAAAGDGSIWLFSSSEAVAHLCAALPGAGWQAARAVATHPRIAEAARAAGFGEVQLSKPGIGDVAASIESRR
ncbi:uroporphyrinogen-III synthase [Xylophilus sp.]|uniref:uroporphyrinogen-III synthase n=1 Tax=Xylophilus sp. TaxID=2653893 RepID=UPI0013B6A660|nr:uroporphyrinogen-III synthase [Xylophilus sp.]KAF1049852.1 MAG: Uroporphyrinogen-III synthase [Xylophilus sp.]